MKNINKQIKIAWKIFLQEHGDLAISPETIIMAKKFVCEYLEKEEIEFEKIYVHDLVSLFILQVSTDWNTDILRLGDI